MNLRPSDWWVVDLDGDPTPGDPFGIGELARRMSSLAADAADASGRVRQASGAEVVQSWVGESGDGYREEIGGFPNDLDKLSRSYGMAGRALTAYAASLDSAQQQADRALAKGRDARARLKTAGAQLTSARTAESGAARALADVRDPSRTATPVPAGGGPPPAPDPTAVAAAVGNHNAAATRLSQAQGAVDAAQGDLDAARRLALAAKGLRESAEDTAVHALHAASDAGIHNKHWWQKPGGRPPRRGASARRRSRTPTGLVDGEVAARLMTGLPQLKVDGGDAGPALTGMVKKALGLDDASLDVAGVGSKGHSGAPVFLVRDGSGSVVAVSKVFPNSEEFVRELSSVERLGSSEFTRFSVPKIHAVAAIRLDGSPAGVLLSSVAPGRPIDDMISAVGQATAEARPQAMQQLRAAVSDTGAALAELHTAPIGSGGAISPEFIGFHTGLTRRLTEEVVARSEQFKQFELDLHELSRRMDGAISATREAVGNASILHGDAHPGNFSWDPDKGITLLDTSDGALFDDERGAPIAAPERDVSNFEQRLAHFGGKFGLGEPDIATLRQDFLTSYHAGGGPPLNDGRMQMFGARSVLSKLLQAADHGSVAPAAQREQIQREIVHLKMALGWK